MKKIMVYISLFFILTTTAGLVLDHAIAQQVDEIPPYCLSFASIGAIFQESRVDAWAKINVGKGEADDVEKIKTALGLRNADWIQQTNGQSRNYALSTGYNCFTIIWKQDTPKQAFLQISIKSSDPNANLPEYENTITSLTGYNWHFNYTYSGEIESVVDDQSMQVLIKTLVENLEGIETNNYRYGESWSATAINDKRPIINHYNRFETAFRRQNQLGKTQVWLGIPGIQISY